MKKLFLLLALTLGLFSCKNDAMVDSEALGIENTIDASETEDLEKISKQSTAELKADLTSKGYQIFDYVNEKTKDTVLMQQYFMAFLKRGPNRSQDSITKVNLQRGHMDNINKLANEGKLVLAGPFFGTDDLRGIYVFDVQSIEEAKQLTETDPAIKAGSLEMELKEWYGSAALMAINDLHKKIAKIEI